MHCHFVGVFEIRPHRHTHRDASDSHTQRLQQLRQVIRRRFAFGVGVGGKDDLFDFFDAQPLEQVLDLQLIWPDPAYRRQRAVQHVIQTSVLASLFHGHQVERFFDDQDHAMVALRACAVAARVDVGDVIAQRTEDDLLFDFLDGFDQAVSFLAVGPQDVKRHTLSRLGSDARHFLKFVDELCYGFCVVEHRLAFKALNR